MIGVETRGIIIGNVHNMSRWHDDVTKRIGTTVYIINKRNDFPKYWPKEDKLCNGPWYLIDLGNDKITALCECCLSID